MNIVIIGGGIAAVYFANTILLKDDSVEIVMLSNEKHPPYDRVYLCNLIDGNDNTNSIELELNSKVQLKLNQNIESIDNQNKIITSNNEVYSYDKLVIATGSTPISLLDSSIKNSAVFRSIDDCEKIKSYYENSNIVLVGSGPISLELLETLNSLDLKQNITLLIRSNYLYSKYLSSNSIKIIEDVLKENKNLTISYNDEIDIQNSEIVDNEIKVLKTKKLSVE
ncbi:hypothetical protein GCM10012288_22320 [Malaciobacter pacificus]|uniref:FAD-dependent oxidoreductase n=1 Tax=Malaciobacter pacificus TaxID=1080223 RepID=UPI00102900F9|nr:FAD/NAD(P)-binding oxidoreductase [Malaciobacter pacificus]GGD47632.1 hypothetical protein GCM10012288_22320 [Malaciobacter pacificus]